MKCLVLCAGYGTRLQKGVQGDSSGKYKNLLGLSKPLLPLGGIPLLSIWIRLLLATEKFTLEDIFLVCNEFFYKQFIDWARETGFPIANIINDGTTTNEGRLGAVKDMELVLSGQAIEEPVVIIGGDTLFFRDFSLTDVIDTFEKRDQSLVLWYKDEMTARTGIIETDDKDLVCNFLEKPQPHETGSRKACPCFYLLTTRAIKILKDYVGAASSLAEVDATGQFIKYLFPREPVYAYPISGRFDIGALDSYIVANDYFQELFSSEKKS